MRYEPVFDMYGIAPPEGDWPTSSTAPRSCFGPGWWPFCRHGTPTGIRVSPDTAFRSWRDEYVLISPGTEATATARVHLFVRRQGTGAMTVLVRITLDLRERAFHLPPGPPEYLREQATTKGQRLLDLLLAVRAARRRGATSPDTAADHAQQQQ